MTKEELEKEAIAKYKTGSYPQLHPDFRAFVHGYLASAEPREKRITELEQQIERMRCCQNCENWNWKHNRCEKKSKGDCFKQSKWVLRKILSKEYA